MIISLHNFEWGIGRVYPLMIWAIELGRIDFGTCRGAEVSSSANTTRKRAFCDALTTSVQQNCRSILNGAFV